MIHVFAGPTLPPDEPLLHQPQVRVLPPVRHGDLFDPLIGDGDTVVVIDGLYHQTPAVRHKEILALLGRDVRVIGAASIGALRAAELADFGMIGVGQIYRAYAAGDIDGDDEVAVGQTPDGDLEALTWPLVNLRHVLALAQQQSVVDAAAASGLLEALRSVYYPQRSSAAVRAVCRRHGAGQVSDWLAAQVSRDRHFGDLKRADALQALQVALAVPRPAPAAVPTTSTAGWETAYFRQWVNHFASERVDGLNLLTRLRLLYQQLFDPGFAQVWFAFADHCSRHPGPGDGEGMPLADRTTHLTTGTEPVGGLPAHAIFRPRVDLRDQDTVTRLLLRETAADRAAIAAYTAANDTARRQHRGFTTEAVQDSVTRELLLNLWRCSPDAFDAEAVARGFRHGGHAVEDAKVFVVGYLAEAAAVRGELVGDAR